MDRVYAHPLYYEIAFSFRDIRTEVDAIEELARRFSSVAVRRVLEVACGSAPHLPEFARRGYAYFGVDHNETMLEYARRRAEDLGAEAAFVQASLTDFSLPAPADLAVVFLGSLYVAGDTELRSHFDAVARALRLGGLYVLDWCVDFVPATDLCETWTEERDGIRVLTTYHAASLNRAEQTYRETVTLEVEDHGAHITLKETAVKRAIYPQEFLLFIKQRPDFEFVGWWNAWKLDQPLDSSDSRCSRPVVVVRRI